MSRTIGYALPDTAAPRLEALVDDIVANSGTLVNLKEVEEASEQMDVRPVLKALPDGFTEDDFVGVLKLAMLTECATDSYAAVFAEGASTHKTPWLTRFNQQVWVPDEYTHYTPYRVMLQSLGYSEEELERDVAEVQERHYEHCCGSTPVELTTYGVIQEYLTDNWHGLIARLLKDGAPLASHYANQIKKRETLHTIWYRKMTAVQIEENPELLGLVSKTLCSFQMPGTRLVPQFGTRALEWMGKTQVDFNLVAKDIVRNFYGVAGSVKRAGELLVDVAVRSGASMGPLPSRWVQAAMNRIGGYSLIGEAALDKIGLPAPSDVALGNREPGLYQRFRRRMRGMIAERIDGSLFLGSPNSQLT